jgi:hypothetical protein
MWLQLDNASRESSNRATDSRYVTGLLRASHNLDVRLVVPSQMAIIRSSSVGYIWPPVSAPCAPSVPGAPRAN